MKVFVSEAKHVDNLCYYRELYKLDLDDKRELSENGELVDRKEVMGIIEDILKIDQALGNLYSQVKTNENRVNSRRIKTVAPMP